MKINSNVSYNQSPNLNAQQSLKNISSGLKVNQASDNASSLAIATKLEANANAYSQAIQNVNSGIALTQIGDRAINEQSNILNTMKEKVLQASTDTTSKEGRAIILQNLQKLAEGLDYIASSTNYNGNHLLQENGTSQEASSVFQSQAGAESSNIIEAGAVQANTLGLNLDSIFNETASSFDSSTARSYIDKIDSAISKLSEYRSEFASTQNQLSSQGRTLITQYTQTSEASSILTAADIAEEIGNFNKANILSQAGAFAQTQSNKINQNVVSRLLA